MGKTVEAVHRGLPQAVLKVSHNDLPDFPNSMSADSVCGYEGMYESEKLRLTLSSN